jgi:hypothetical protein
MEEGTYAVLLLLELKYCEACGGLWLRQAGSLEVYCERCAERMGEIALGKAGRYAN